MLQNGLYEQVINKGLEEELSKTDQLIDIAPIDAAEAAKLFAKYIAEVTERGLLNLQDSGGDIQAQIALVNRMPLEQGPELWKQGSARWILLQWQRKAELLWSGLRASRQRSFLRRCNRAESRQRGCL